MSPLRVVAVAGLGAPTMFARAAIGCPVCISDTGAQIRAMLAVDPLWHLAATFAPVPVLLAVVAGVRLATPWLSKEGGTRDVDVARREPI